MENWQELSAEENHFVWERVYNEFYFEPSIHVFPGFQVPKPFITYNIFSLADFEKNLESFADLEAKVRWVFQGLIAPDEYIYALDWQHAGYRMNPHLEMRRNEWNEWLVPLYPDGDYYFYLQKDFEWGYLGHPWEGTITLFGEKLLERFEKHRPLLFAGKLREG
ncbi:DUF2716 domain-containing protein [Planococcus sp. FY231025]|uniref:DUF2716 domain-containing protein n=1 Tax=Planococcus sp. FY231025 TaxID=3455699 RepID=UPI003F8E5070